MKYKGVYNLEKNKDRLILLVESSIWDRKNMGIREVLGGEVWVTTKKIIDDAVGSFKMPIQFTEGLVKRKEEW